MLLHQSVTLLTLWFGYGTPLSEKLIESLNPEIVYVCGGHLNVKQNNIEKSLKKIDITSAVIKFLKHQNNTQQT